MVNSMGTVAYVVTGLIFISLFLIFGNTPPLAFLIVVGALLMSGLVFAVDDVAEVLNNILTELRKGGP